MVDRNVKIPATLPAIVLDEAVLLPGAVAGLEADDHGAELARELLATPERLALVGLRKSKEGAAELELHPIGVAVRIENVAPGGAVIVTSLARVRVLGLVEEGERLHGRVEAVEEPRVSGPEIEALALEARRLAREILAFLPGVPAQVAAAIEALKDPGKLADLLGHRVPANAAEKQRLLEAIDPAVRLRLLVELLARRRAVLEVAKKIEGTVQEKVTKAEREHFLRKRIEAIQAELGEGKAGEEGADDELEKKLAEAGLPEDVKAQIQKELARLRKLPAQSPERSVARTWLQWIADLPWSAKTEDNLDLENARATLEADHHGLEKVKKRIVQFLAVRRLRGDAKGPILCLVGPPGVGKTSLGQSIARTMGRKLVRVSLGGVRDEAEIRGHRRTYVGALPGRIVQALRRAGTVNPILQLDEVDKLGAGFQGDPAAALLEVLDPEQNHAFVDHYLEVPVDLSRVLFIATANSLDTIPPPLRDRMEVLEIPSYTHAEKVEIARRHLIQRQLEANGLAGADVRLEDAALARIVQAYTREAGVRGLEKRLADVCRALAVERAAGTLRVPRIVAEKELEGILGPDRFQPEPRDAAAGPGIASGLAWTPVGGEVLTIEAVRMPGKGQVILSGQLGGVMQESARAALSYAQSHAAELGLPEKPLDGHDLHVHVPAGGTPKDGPSAGVTLFTAIVSLLSGNPVRADTAMTGEATLRGRVLPVGGIKEKVLAAHRAGIRRVILPSAVAPELRDVPAEVRDALDIVLVQRMDEVLDAALERPVQRPAPLLAAA